METNAAAIHQLQQRLEAERTARIRAEVQRDAVRALLDQAPLLLFQLSPGDLVFEYVNQAALSFHRGRPLLGRSVFDAFPEFEVERIGRFLRHVMAKGEMLRLPEVFLEMDVDADGELEGYYFEAAFQPTFDANHQLTGLLISATDITARVRDRARVQELARASEERLLSQNDVFKESEERYRTLVDLAPVPIAVHANGTIVYVNAETQRMMGATRPEQLLGRNILEFVHPSSHELVMARARQVLADREPTEVMEERFVRLDGVPIDVQTVAMPLVFDGKPAVQVVMQDITVRKKAESHRLELEALKRTDELKDQFISILSHELRTPLQAIMGFGSILNDELAGPISPDQHAYLNKMLTGAEQLLGLVSDLLDISRIQAGKFSLDPRPIDFYETVTVAVDALHSLAEESRLQLVSSFGDGQPVVHADEQRVIQVMFNLIGNAVKFTPPGGTVSVRALIEGDHVRCEVADTGPGIPQADLPRLFQRFSQLDMSSTRRAKGTGLGLSICKAIVEAHGGAIGVSSRPGEGSVFWFTLPLLEQ